MATKARLTAEDLWRIPADDIRRELVDGKIIEMAPAGGIHGKYVTVIARRLADHVERHGGGEVLTGDVGFILNLPRDPERVRAPDVAFISTARLPGGELPREFLRGAPDLAVEVLSPSESPIEVQQKVREYLDSGARLVWIVAPDANTVTAYRADGTAQLLRESDMLQGEDVLPGFSLRLGDFF
ncbi:MAG: Uma2 family endonuclease [Acidobacteria bacterium]|nr:MAG: Uma2 family endonuclease [Acidobacteriota bacterium]